MKNQAFKNILQQCRSVLTLLLLGFAASIACGQVLPPSSVPYGLSYSDWSAKWWQWTLSQSTNQMDLVSGPISGPVEFLAGAPGSVNETRKVTIPAGTALFFPVLANWADNSDCPVFDTNTLAQLQAIEDGNWNVVSETTCTIDGVAVTNLDNPQTTPYFTKATPFSYTTALSNSVLNTVYGNLPCIPGGTTVNPAVADGVYLMLAPLAPGIHTVHYIGIVGPTNSPFVTMNLTYQITVSNNYFPPNVTPYGVSYADWAAKWWQWTLSQTTDQTNYVSDTISGPVKLLAGAPGSVNETRNVTIPAGTALFFPVLANWADNSDCPVFDTNTLTQLQAIEDGNWTAASETVCTIDGAAVTNLDSPQTSGYFTKATPFGYTTALHDSVIQTVYGNLPCIAGGTPVSPAVADGVYIMTAPLAPGIHTIHYIGIVGPTNAPYVHQDLIYQVTVLTTSGNYPPAAAPYGLSYADWAAKWWQWNLSQSTDVTPLVSGPIAGPVQFLAGAPGNITATRNVTLPAGTAVFFPILANWDDNSDCPTFDTNTLAQLQATEDGNWSAVTATACTIDGVPVTGLDNPQTTGYYIQATPFSYVTATNDSVIDLPCVPGGTTISPAVADGVYLMSAPLTAGLHTIHIVGAVGSHVHQDITYQITVLPISLSIAAQGASTKLSWPQTTVNYGLENTPVLNSQIWSPVTTPIQTNSGIIQTVVTNRGSQFFRVRSQQ
jgi:hypothetical protein